MMVGESLFHLVAWSWDWWQRDSNLPIRTEETKPHDSKNPTGAA